MARHSYHRYGIMDRVLYSATDLAKAFAEHGKDALDMILSGDFPLGPRRHKTDYPYSYSSFVTFVDMDVFDGDTEFVYSDRLQQWDHEKYERLADKWFPKGASFADLGKEAVRSFLRDWNDDPGLDLALMEQGCNRATGYPYMVFGFNRQDTGNTFDKGGK